MSNHALSMLGNIGNWNYALLAVLVIIEGPVVTLFAGMLASTRIMNPWLVFLVASLSNMFADFIWYSLGHFSGPGKLKWTMKKVGIDGDAIDVFIEEMRTHSWSIIFTAKLTLSFTIPTFFSAGVSGISWFRVLYALLPAEVIWTGGLVLGGYYYGKFFQQIEFGIGLMGALGAVIFLLVLIHYLKLHVKKMQDKWRMHKNEDTDVKSDIRA